jgi:hypothetical protein
MMMSWGRLVWKKWNFGSPREWKGGHNVNRIGEHLARTALAHCTPNLGQDLFNLIAWFLKKNVKNAVLELLFKLQPYSIVMLTCCCFISLSSLKLAIRGDWRNRMCKGAGLQVDLLISQDFDMFLIVNMRNGARKWHISDAQNLPTWSIYIIVCIGVWVNGKQKLKRHYS